MKTSLSAQFPAWISVSFSAVGLLFLSQPLFAQAEEVLSNSVPSSQLSYSTCLEKALLSEADNTTLGEIRNKCRATQNIIKPLTERNLNEEVTEKNPFVITPHRVNYAAFAHYTTQVNKEPFEEQSGKDLAFENQELQFQLSFKFPLYKDLKIFDKEFDFYAAYTNRSFWQFFDDADSIPFRETNHEPEVWVEWDADIDLLDFNLHKMMFGINHQSNGQTGLLSRGWNRIFVQGLLQHKNSYLSFKTWQRFDEQDEFDNSFDYQKYLGDYELEAAYKWKDRTFAMTLRNRYQINSYGSIQLEFTRPINRRFKGYIQYFNGYGDSLIDMQHYGQKFAIGVVLVDRI
ncbi:phospholipase A [Thiomicrorhabdus sp. 6S2-11]|uniref:Phospholipase A1 n=1 Tax=Thiomicrorhabdus marina TaxID=2818442 RepID=A0ABS3Q828_9GAMM|nr:phospholipase A [Thiomicrorhabdus marina]MBO1928089.1 phospholipase A [Thiomicrorhabdus marina]